MVLIQIKKEKEVIMAKFMLIAILIMLNSSCSTETVMYWNWKDVIGISIIGILLFAVLMFTMVEMIKNKYGKYKQKKKGNGKTN